MKEPAVRAKKFIRGLDHHHWMQLASHPPATDAAALAAVRSTDLISEEERIF